MGICLSGEYEEASTRRPICVRKLQSWKVCGEADRREQTINRSQKSAGGIIGSTKRRQFVAQWEMIHHEMLVVVNLQCTVSGVVTPSRELLVNDDFNLPATRSSETLIEDMIGYIKEHDNPVTSSAQKSKDDP